MKVRVLGAAAGGGLPQWNCGCSNCAAARAGDPAVRPQSQSSIAVSADGESWVLVNASPDIRGQIEAFPALRLRDGVRGSAVSAVFLTDGEIDHTSGLLFLREGGRLSLYGTSFVKGALRKSGVLPTLESYLAVRWTEIVGEAPIRLLGREWEDLGLEAEAFEVAGDAPLYYRENGARAAGFTAVPGSTIGVRIRSRGSPAGLVYVPGAGAADPITQARVGPEDVLLWDGTFWTNEELVRLGITDRRALDMGHLPISGPEGSLERFRPVPARRKVYIHINNTNPILRSDSPERRAVEAAGWEVAFDGMEFDI
jgi:pyrroloquinoline quinone biosynthesis protein B